MTNQPIPPIVQTMIDNLNDRKLPQHIRMNFRDALQNISDTSFRAIKRFDREVGIKRPKVVSK